MAVERKYLYKVSRDGEFLGVLNNVTSEFGYTNEINTAGSSTRITVQSTADVASQSIEAIQTEAGIDITDESSNLLLIERQPDIVGNTNSNALIRNDNDVEVIEFSPENPNGQTVFTGRISKWGSSFGVDNEEIKIDVLGYGSELDNYIIQAGGYTLDQEQASTDYIGLQFSTSGSSETIEVGQSFVAGASVTSLAKISVDLHCIINPTATAVLTFGRGTPDNQLEVLATVSKTVDYTGAVSHAFVDFSFEPVTIVPGQTYFFTLYSNPIRPSSGGPAFYARVDTTEPYTNGIAYYYSNDFGWYTYGGDITFRTYTNGGSVVSNFLNADVTDIVTDIIDDFNGRGGIVTYSPSTVETTGVIVDYDYKLNTILEGIKKARTLAPANWYWYIDPATNLLWFKSAATVADWLFIRGKHIAELEIGVTVERRKNVVYFTGGDTGSGENLFVTGTDSTSTGSPRGLERLTDNRVTLTDTATTIVTGFLDENAGEQYETTVRLEADQGIDLNDVAPGQMIGFAGFNSFVDDLLLQIVSVKHSPDYVDLSLGVPPRRASITLETIRRNLNEVQTVDNPSTAN